MVKLVSEKTMRFLTQMLSNQGKVTFKTQKLYRSRLMYYMMVWHLRDLKLIKEAKKGWNKKTNEKVWVLTEKGERVANLFKELLEILEGM